MPRKKSQNKSIMRVETFTWEDPVCVENFDKQVDEICGKIAELLKEKNKSYGNAALDPIRIFSAANSEEQIRVRIDDKLSRIKRGNNSFKEDTVVDLIGYLVLLIIAQQK